MGINKGNNSNETGGKTPNKLSLNGKVTTVLPQEFEAKLQRAAETGELIVADYDERLKDAIKRGTIVQVSVTKLAPVPRNKK